MVGANCLRTASGGRYTGLARWPPGPGHCWARSPFAVPQKGRGVTTACRRKSGAEAWVRARREMEFGRGFDTLVCLAKRYLPGEGAAHC